jgi:hypothetical protein
MLMPNRQYRRPGPRGRPGLHHDRTSRGNGRRRNGSRVGGDRVVGSKLDGTETMSMVFSWRGILAICLAAIFSASPGCAGSGDDLDREAVSGTVMLDGEPLVGGAIQFFPATNAGGVAVGGGSPVENGRFSIAREYGLVPGSYKVAINAAEPETAGAKTKGAARKGRVQVRDLIPARYNSETTLKAEIDKGGTSSLTFDLESK